MKDDHNIDFREIEYKRRYAMLLATAWRDAEFMNRLIRQPKECLEEFGITVPKGKKISVHVDSDDEFHIVIPSAPPDFGEPIEMVADEKCWKSQKCWNLCD